MTSLQACQYYIPDLNGSYVAHSADIQADRKTLNDILSSFKQAEAALQHRDIDGIMELYSDNYKYHNFNKLTLRQVWTDLLQGNHDFSTTHVFTKIKLEADILLKRLRSSLREVFGLSQMRPTNALTSTVGSERSITWFPRMVHGVFVAMPGKASRKRNRVSYDLPILFLSACVNYGKFENVASQLSTIRASKS